MSNDMDSLFDLQRQALDDPRLDDDDKLLFCRLLCDTGLRNGWVLSNAKWDRHRDIVSLRRLHDAAYLSCRHKDDAVSVELERAPTESCPVCGCRTRATNMVSLSRTVRMCLDCHDESDDRDQT